MSVLKGRLSIVSQAEASRDMRRIENDVSNNAPRIRFCWHLALNVTCSDEFTGCRPKTRGGDKRKMEMRVTEQTCDGFRPIVNCGGESLLLDLLIEPLENSSIVSVDLQRIRGSSRHPEPDRRYTGLPLVLVPHQGSERQE